MTSSSAVECGDLFREWLIGSFPILPVHFSSSSIAVETLKRISRTIPSVHVFERDISLKLSQVCLKVEHSPSVIEALIAFTNTAPCPVQEQEQDDSQYDDLLVKVKVKQSQRQRKGAKSKSVVIFDTKLARACQLLGLSVPTTVERARDDLYILFKDLCDALKVNPVIYYCLYSFAEHFMQFYLNLLCDPAVQASIRKTFSPAPVPVAEEVHEAEETQNMQQEAVAVVPSNEPITLPHAQRMNA